LVTTREAAIAQVLGASTYSLDVMTENQAMELLTKKLKQLNRSITGEEYPLASKLAKAVGYLPLALDLAAAQVASIALRAYIRTVFKSGIYAFAYSFKFR